MFMQAVQAKKVKLSNKLSKFYPEAPAASKITMRQLLQMTSGLIHRDTNYGTPKYKNNQSDIKYDLKKTKFEQAYYNKRNYQPINYVLLAGIIEKVDHQSYEKVFTRTFIKKLKLKQTTFVWSNASSVPRKILATSYSDNNTPIKLNMNELRGEFGTGSVVMSNKDLYTTIRAILDGTLLSKRARNSLFEGSSDAVLGGNYGGGFYNFPTFHAANGSGNGYTNFVRVSNDGNSMIIMQTNYPIKGYFKLRGQMNNLMESLLSNNG